MVILFSPGKYPAACREGNSWVLLWIPRCLRRGNLLIKLSSKKWVSFLKHKCLFLTSVKIKASLPAHHVNSRETKCNVSLCAAKALHSSVRSERSNYSRYSREATEDTHWSADQAEDKNWGNDWSGWSRKADLVFNLLFGKTGQGMSCHPQTALLPVSGHQYYL